jgi:glycosyltransferase involved in cell wall biosynthesis
MAMTMIRVAHVITRFHGAGGAKDTYYSIAGLDPNRFAVDLIVGASADRHRAAGLAVTWIPIPTLHRAVRPLDDLRTALALRQLFRRRGYHIVHTHLAKAGILGRWAAHQVGVPIILHSLHGATFNTDPGRRTLADRLYLALERRAALWTDRILSVGADLTARYLAAGIGRPEQYVLIHSGMDLEAFRAARQMTPVERLARRREWGLGEEHFIAGYVAALEWRKGHRFLLQAARPICARHPQVRLLFAGEGHDRQRIERLVAAAGLSDRVIFTGYRTDIAAVMATFDLKLFAGTREGLPQVLVQAAAVGLPVLAFAAEGVTEMVHDGGNGFVLPPGDIAGMVRAWDMLIAQPDLRRRMAAYGPTLVDDRWQIATMQAKTRALYETLLAEKGL